MVIKPQNRGVAAVTSYFEKLIRRQVGRLTDVIQMHNNCQVIYIDKGGDDERTTEQ